MRFSKGASGRGGAVVAGGLIGAGVLVGDSVGLEKGGTKGTGDGETGRGSGAQAARISPTTNREDALTESITTP
jgi:hypothetical protein